jgi:hypothetical protein
MPNGRDGLIHGGRPSQPEVHSVKRICRQFSQLEQLIRPRRPPPSQLDSARFSVLCLYGHSLEDIHSFAIRHVLAVLPYALYKKPIYFGADWGSQ